MARRICHYSLVTDWEKGSPDCYKIKLSLDNWDLTVEVVADECKEKERQEKELGSGLMMEDMEGEGQTLEERTDQPTPISRAAPEKTLGRRSFTDRKENDSINITPEPEEDFNFLSGFVTPPMEKMLGGVGSRRMSYTKMLSEGKENTLEEAVISNQQSDSPRTTEDEEDYSLSWIARRLSELVVDDYEESCNECDYSGTCSKGLQLHKAVSHGLKNAIRSQ